MLEARAQVFGGFIIGLALIGLGAMIESGGVGTPGAEFSRIVAESVRSVSYIGAGAMFAHGVISAIGSRK